MEPETTGLDSFLLKRNQKKNSLMQEIKRPNLKCKIRASGNTN